MVLSPCSLFPIWVPAFATHRVLQSQRLDRPGRLSIIAEGPAAGKAQVPSRLLLLTRHYIHPIRPTRRAGRRPEKRHMFQIGLDPSISLSYTRLT